MADHAYTLDKEGYEKSLKQLEQVQYKKKKYSKAIIALCLLTVIAYTTTCLYYLWNAKPLNDVLTVLFFACFGMEFASLAFIKGREIRYVEGNPANKQMPHVEVKETDND